jgi:hypothetical protein
MEAALALEARAQELALAGQHAAARSAFREAAARYRVSWELASATSYGRLVGMLKAAILAGEGDAEAAYARAQIAGADQHSVTAAYVRALAALVVGEDSEARRWGRAMKKSPGAFARAAQAVDALAARDAGAYREALAEIVGDFEQRPKHLTGVAIADTALMFECLAERRGMRVDPTSPVLPSPI